MKRNRKQKVDISSSILEEVNVYSNNPSNGNGHTNHETVDTQWSKIKTKREKKIKFDFLLKLLKSKVSLKENQLIYSKKIEDNTITFAIGVAGTSKTFSACYTLLKLLFEEKIDKIIFTKPIKESGENLGFLPGDVEQKMAPYMESFIYTCKEMLGENYINTLIENGYIENRPLAYMRGCTFNRCGMFLDEFQNSSYHQMMLYITRLGDNSKIVIAGDVTQSDIKNAQVFQNNFLDIFTSIESVVVHKFEKSDIVRNPLLVKITDNYENWKEKNNIH